MQSLKFLKYTGYSFAHDRFLLVVQKRYRYKKKWAVNLRPKTSCELALDHFDAFYKPVHGEHWPSIRVALLSLPKYAAIVNNFGDTDSTIQQLRQLGAVDMIDSSVKRVTKMESKLLAEIQARKEKADTGGGVIDLKNQSQNQTDHSTGVDYESKEIDKDSGEDFKTEHLQNVFTPDTAHNNTDLQYFVPTQKVYSEREALRQEEEKTFSTYQDRPISVRILPEHLPALSKTLKVMTFKSGDVSDFPSPRANNMGLLNYYLLDGASILPVLALEVQPNDSVLDLCAAPGGKTLAMLQLIITQGGHLTANDISYSRIDRLYSVLRSYVSKDFLAEFVHVQNKNGKLFNEPVFDKVLVDVPCNSDRHVLEEEDNNLFKPSRIKERLQLTSLQKDLLMSGIRSCKPGGSIVYSTCTLAPAQNDGVVQAAVEELWETSDFDVVVENISPLATLLQPFFKFHKSTRLGQLVLPSLVNNFGPMYFCKLKRLR